MEIVFVFISRNHSASFKDYQVFSTAAWPSPWGLFTLSSVLCPQAHEAPKDPRIHPRERPLYTEAIGRESSETAKVHSMDGVHVLCANPFAFGKRFLLLPLLSAERSWSLAMELKEQQDNPRARFHMMRKLKKAVKSSNDLVTLCASTADDKTKLEAEAYSCWMTGNLRLEEEEWDQALESFMRARWGSLTYGFKSRLPVCLVSYPLAPSLGQSMRT